MSELSFPAPHLASGIISFKDVVYGLNHICISYIRGNAKTGKTDYQDAMKFLLGNSALEDIPGYVLFPVDSDTIRRMTDADVMALIRDREYIRGLTLLSAELCARYIAATNVGFAKPKPVVAPIETSTIPSVKNAPENNSVVSDPESTEPFVPETKVIVTSPIEAASQEIVDDPKGNLPKSSVVINDIVSAETELDFKMKTVLQISKIQDLTAEHLVELNNELDNASYERMSTEHAGATFHRFVLGNTPAGNMFVAFLYTLIAYALLILLAVGGTNFDGIPNTTLSTIMRYVFFPTTSIFGMNALLFIVDFTLWYSILFKILMKRIELVGFKTWLLKFFGSPVGELPEGFWFLPFWKIYMYTIDESKTCELSRTCRIESVEVVSPTTLVKWKIAESFVDVARDPNDNTFNLWNYQNKNGTQSDYAIQNAVENAIRNAAKLTVTIDQQVYFNNFTNMFAYEFAKLNPQIQKVGYRFVSLRKPRTVEIDRVTREQQEQEIRIGGTLKIIQQIFAAVKAMNSDASEEFYYAILRAHGFEVPLHRIAEVKRTGKYGTLIDALRVDM